MISFIFLIVNRLIWAYTIAIVVYALLTWLPGASQSKLAQVLERIVGPFLNLFNFATFGGIGFGPVLAIICLDIIQQILAMIQAALI